MSRVTNAATDRWSVDEYYRLGEIGSFHEDDRVELLNGEIIVMSPVGVRHIIATRRLINVLVKLYGQHCWIDAHNPVMIDHRSMPQPDFMLLRPDLDESRAPGPSDVLLLVEAADSSLAYDMQDKRAAYARSGIVEYWILDLIQDRLHVFREPTEGGYRSEQIISKDEKIAPQAFPNESVAVSQLLPPS